MRFVHAVGAAAGCFALVSMTACSGGGMGSPAAPTVASASQAAAAGQDDAATKRGDTPPEDPPKEEPPPPTGGEGCTPGYWKQQQHFDSWTGYTPGQTFGSAFGQNSGNPLNNMTLLAVLSQGGGGIKALGRHAVAALLNAASPGVDYDVAVVGVIDAFNAAFASGNYETQKNIFAALNEQGCPLN